MDAPSAGKVTATVGAAVSTVQEYVAEPAFPAASVAVTVSECEPSASPL